LGFDGSEEFKDLFVAESLGIGPSLGGGDDEVVFFIKAVIDGVVNLLLIDVVVLSSFLNVVTAEEFVNLLFKLFTFDSFGFFIILFGILLLLEKLQRKNISKYF
jgi:hypothetical protein